MKDVALIARHLVGRDEELAATVRLLDAPEPCTAAELLERFDPAALEREPRRIDPASLHW